MKPLRQFLNLFRRAKLEAEMTAEMQAHVDLQTDRNIAAGMSSTEARYAALRQFGNVAKVQEQVREARGWLWLEQFGQDLRFAVRMLGKTPGVTITAVLTLGLGIGVNAALFAVYDILALRSLPSRDPDQLVDIRGRNEQVRGGINANFSYPDYLDYRAGTQAFSDLIASTDIGVKLALEAVPEPESEEAAAARAITLYAVSGNYFSMLGMEFALGRDFLPEEAGLHAGRPVMIISHSFWQSRLEGDPNVLGRMLVTEGPRGTGRTAYTIIGVAAPDFVGQSPLAPAGWVPLTGTPYPLEDRTQRQLWMTGRLRAGVSLPQAKAELDAMAQHLAQAYPEKRRANAVQLTPAMRILAIGLNRELALALSPVLLGFALVLVISCLNVANLLLARGVTRQHEIGVRLVLGAGRGRLVRQLFAENLLLCFLGAGAALVMAMWALQILKPAIVSILASEPKAQAFVNMIDIGLDGRIVGFGALLAVVAGLTAGLAPALHSVQRDGVFALKGEGSAFGRKLTPSRLRGMLLVGQVAACLMLLAVCGLMSGKLLRMRAADTGFVTDGVYVVAPSAAAGTPSVLATDPLGAVETLRNLPGVASACLVQAIPLRKPGDNIHSVAVLVDGSRPERISHNRVTAGFFEAFGVPVVRGRAFTPQEAKAGAQVVVVSESAAKRLWPGKEPLDRILAVEDTLFIQRPAVDGEEVKHGYSECVVIGVSRDFLSDWGGNQGKDLMFLPPSPKGAGSILLRVQADTAEALKGIERTAKAAGMPVKFQDKLAKVVDRSLWPYRAFASISGTLTGLSLLLATVGLYGVVSFGVNQQVREIGVRMALGATAERVTGFFVRQGMKLVAYGVVFGLIGGSGFAVLLAKVMPGAGFSGTLGFRVLVFAVVTALLALVAFVACWLPARRAAKVDPMIALRAE